MAAFSLLKSLLPFRGRRRGEPAVDSGQDVAAESGAHQPRADSADAALAALSQAGRGAPEPSGSAPARAAAAPRRGRPRRDPPRRDAPGRTADTAPHTLSAEELGIERRRIHPHVLHVVRTLHQQGFQALLVGGAVRDLLLGRTPKDFDVVTSARPEQVRRIFRNARIIGRRFRLCLLRFGGMQVEVSTFRGLPGGDEPGPQHPGRMIRRDNTFGTPREDAFRRDFTINALALDTQRMQVLDYVDGLEDLKARRIRTISPAAVSFAEDPVRMLRALRFQVRLGFALDPALESALKTHAPGLAQVKRHRLADETQRFLTSGFAERMFEQFQRRHLLQPLLGLESAQCFDPRAVADPLPALRPLLAGLERWVAGGRETLPPTVALLALIVTLARPELRGYLLGRPAATDRERKALRHLKRTLPGQLVEWGLLRGQMEPALRILATARLLLRYRAGAPPARRRRLGEREAWLLLGALQPVLELREEFIAEGLARVPHLADLPILDHPRPDRRGAGDSSQVAAAPGRIAQEAEQPGFSDGQPSSTRRRKRRRRGRSPGRGAASGPA